MVVDVGCAASAGPPRIGAQASTIIVQPVRSHVTLTSAPPPQQQGARGRHGGLVGHLAFEHERPMPVRAALAAAARSRLARATSPPLSNTAFAMAT